MIQAFRFLTGVRAAVVAAALLAAPLVTTEAHAGIDACGNIDIDAHATCKVEVSGGCVTHCQDLKFEAACAGECTPTCTKLPEVTCTGNCELDCNTECTVNPGEFDCQGTCEADCSGSCEGSCASSDNKTECEGQCKATCTSECSGSCSGTPPSAECSGKCKAKCEGQCKADLNMDCNLKCQGSCSAKLEGGCETQCSKPEGALFCDGEYVDQGGNAQECIDAIEAFIKAHVDVSARGSAECAKGVCTAEGSASCSCSTPGRHKMAENTMYGAAAASGLLAMFAMARRKRQ
jgi:hypothetical protein